MLFKFMPPSEVNLYRSICQLSSLF